MPVNATPEMLLQAALGEIAADPNLTAQQKLDAQAKAATALACTPSRLRP
jgi:hypothetical protein